MNYYVARVQYSYNKLDKIRAGVYPDWGGNIEFELFNFFEVAYHLKEYIKKSENYEFMTDVEDFINESAPLRVCADICNTLKHKERNKNSRSKMPIGRFNLSIFSQIGPNSSFARNALPRATIHTELGEMCCYNLAKLIIEEWNRYFKINGLKTVLTSYDY